MVHAIIASKVMVQTMVYENDHKKHLYMGEVPELQIKIHLRQNLEGINKNLEIMGMRT